MNSIRWQKPKWLPRFLATPLPEPVQQAARILSIQRNIILPARLMVSGLVFYYLFYQFPAESATWGVVLETMQQFFIFYIIFNAIAAAFLILRRFPPRLVQWVVFSVGLVDGLLLAGLTLATGGFASALFWVFPGLILLNAISIPLATPQIVLNLFLSAFYLSAGYLYIVVEQSPGDFYPTKAIRDPGPIRFSASDILDAESFAFKLKKPNPADASYEVSRFLTNNFSLETQMLLAAFSQGTNAVLVHALVDDLNHIIQNKAVYDSNRFANVKLSSESLKLLSERPAGGESARLNRRLLQDAYPREILKRRRNWMSERDTNNPALVEGGVPENPTELWVLRLIILWLLTAACYGLQLLMVRERMSEEEERKSAARNDELKAAGRLAAEIAHQMKNPLGIINNAVFSLQRGLREGKRDLDLQLQIIREEIERSDRILTQLMGYAQLSEGRVEKLIVEEELDRALTEVFPPGAAYTTQIHRDYGTNLPIMLMQRNHLSVVLVNLLQNAREALNGKGNIHLRAHYGDSNTLQFVIEDDGPGIPFGKLDKIFEAYVTTKEKGTGLGLAIVKHNVELYGGAVRAESEPGKGARFILLFPAKTFIVKDS